MCEENIYSDVVAQPRKKYRVSANKHEYVSDGYDTAVEAVTAVNDLIARGFANISVSDTEQEGEIW